MTSSEHNRVSIPPQRSGIGLTDDWSCDSSQQLAFHSVLFYRFFCWKPAPVHIHTSTHCQFIIQEYRFSGSLQQLESMSNLG